MITSSRVAELSAIFFFSGWSSAVIDSTARRTSSALIKPEPEADAEEHTEHRMSVKVGRSGREHRQRDAD